MANRKIDAAACRLIEREQIVLIAEKVFNGAHAGRERIGMYPRVDWHEDGTMLLHKSAKIAHKFNPRTSIADAFEMEEAIPKEKRPQYLRNLSHETGAFMENRGSHALHERDWKLTHATPAQRVDAAIAVLEGE